MGPYFTNDSVEITKMDNNIFVIKLLKQLPKKKDLKEYHDEIIDIYKKHEKLSLILELFSLNVWSVCIASGELKFFDSICEQTIKQVRSVAFVCRKTTSKIIEFFFKDYEKRLPYKFANNFVDALYYSNTFINIVPELGVE